MFKIKNIILAIAIVIGSSGCATIVSDNDTGVYLTTVPENAVCEMKGKEFVRKVNTPASVIVPAKAAPVVITCEAENYAATSDTMNTSADGWILGNLLFGGIIGVAIDAANGSGQKFPSDFSIVLRPSQFATLAERDQWFDNRKAQIQKRWDDDLDKARAACSSSKFDAAKADQCKKAIEKAEAERDSELQTLENERSNAVIAQAEI